MKRHAQPTIANAFLRKQMKSDSDNKRKQITDNTVKTVELYVVDGDDLDVVPVKKI